MPGSGLSGIPDGRKSPARYMDFGPASVSGLATALCRCGGHDFDPQREDRVSLGEEVDDVTRQ